MSTVEAGDLLRTRMMAPPAGPGTCGSVGRFEVVRLLGQGGMGQVWLAREPITGTTVALKMIKPEFLHNERVVHRFLTEARHMYRMSHANILKVMEVSDRAEGPYFVMPYVSGGCLAQQLQERQALSAEEILPVARQIADALVYAHGQGIIHRDLKPANVLVDREGHAHLTDFGLVRTVFNDSLIDVGKAHVEGTVPYMSPGVAAGKAEDTRCDIYSFGAMLYEMLTGRPPYREDSVAAMLHKVTSEPPTAVGSLVPDAPDGLVVIIEGCMARELRDRYAEMQDVLNDLDRVGRQEMALGPHERGDTSPPATGWSKVRSAATSVAATAGIVFLVAGLWYGVKRSRLKHGRDAKQASIQTSVQTPMQAVTPPPQSPGVLPTPPVPVRQSRTTFSSGPAMPEARSHGDAVVHGGTLYYIGGRTANERESRPILAFNIQSQTWQTLQHSEFPGKPGFGAAVVGNTIYAVGGGSSDTTTDAVWAFDLTKGRWSQARRMPRRTSSLTGSVVGFEGRVYVVGGNLFGRDWDVAHIYDPVDGDDGRWAVSAPMHLARRGAAVAVCRGLLYVAGSGGNPNPSVEVYDPARGTWACAADLPESRGNGEAVTAAGEVYIVGGEGKRYNEVWCYSPVGDSWRTVATIPSDMFRKLTQVVAVADVASGIKLYLLGGYDPETKSPLDRMDIITITPSHPELELPAERSQTGCAVTEEGIWVVGGCSGPGAHQDLWRFTLDDGRFRQMASLPAPRRGLSLVAAEDSLYAIGGTPDPISARNVYRYAIRSDEWTEMAPMATPRSNFGAALIGNRIYVFAGGNNGWPTTSAEVYEIDTNTWRAIAPFPYKAQDLCATPSPDGRVFLFGCHAWRVPSERKPYTDVIVYDPERNTYSVGTPSPVPRPHASAVAWGEDEIIVAGGSRDIDVYNWRQDTWRPLRQLPLHRGETGVALFWGNLWVIGGATPYEGRTASVLVYSLPRQLCTTK